MFEVFTNSSALVVAPKFCVSAVVELKTSDATASVLDPGKVMVNSFVRVSTTKDVTFANSVSTLVATLVWTEVNRAVEVWTVVENSV